MITVISTYHNKMALSPLQHVGCQDLCESYRPKNIYIECCLLAKKDNINTFVKAAKGEKGGRPKHISLDVSMVRPNK